MEPSIRMLALKGKIDRMLDDLVKQVPGTNPIEATLALVAVAGTSIRNMPDEVKGKIFGAAIGILGQESGFRTMQANVGRDEIADLQGNLKKGS